MTRRQKIEVVLSFGLYAMAGIGIVYCLGFRPTNAEIALGYALLLCGMCVAWLLFIAAHWLFGR